MHVVPGVLLADGDGDKDAGLPAGPLPPPAAAEGLVGPLRCAGNGGGRRRKACGQGGGRGQVRVLSGWGEGGSRCGCLVGGRRGGAGVGA